MYVCIYMLDNSLDVIIIIIKEEEEEDIKYINTYGTIFHGIVINLGLLCDKIPNSDAQVSPQEHAYAAKLKHCKYVFKEIFSLSLSIIIC